MEYNFREIEKKWQARWVEKKTYQVTEDESKQKLYSIVIKFLFIVIYTVISNMRHKFTCLFSDNQALPIDFLVFISYIWGN